MLIIVQVGASRLNPAARQEATNRFLNLLFTLVMRDITVRYPRSILGLHWPSMNAGRKRTCGLRSRQTNW